MSPFSKISRSRLAEEFADIYQDTLEDYRALLSDLRNDDVDLNAFRADAEGLMDRLIKLKRIRLQLSHERAEILRMSRNDEAA